MKDIWDHMKGNEQQNTHMQISVTLTHNLNIILKIRDFFIHFSGGYL